MKPGDYENKKAKLPGNVMRALIAGVLANLAVAVTKFVAFLFTGSSAMLAEALHSTADSTNQALLAFGMKRAARPPTEDHPFGFGKERYFWAFIVALMVFLLGGAFAIYEGVHKLSEPSPITNPAWNFGALAIAMVVEGYALRVAWVEFGHWRAENPGRLLDSLRHTKDPTLPTVLFEDTAALIGLLIATAGILVSVLTGDPVWDAMASIAIGVVLLGVAGFLAVESHSLLLGESASPKDREAITKAVLAHPAVQAMDELLTVHRGPNEIQVSLRAEFSDGLTTNDIEAAVIEIETIIRDVVPFACFIFVEAGAVKRP